MSVAPAIGAAALIALAACGPVASPLSTNDVRPSASAVPQSPQTNRDMVPLIVFTRTMPVDDQRTFTIGIDGLQETELTDVNSCCGSWSPDGTIITVPDELAESRVLPATVNPDGTSYAVHSIGPPTLNLGPSGWSPDGNKFVFEGWDDTDPSRTGLYVSGGFSLTGAAPVQITKALLHDTALDWSPDGTRLLLI